jgi:hypothetical protein
MRIDLIGGLTAEIPYSVRQKLAAQNDKYAGRNIWDWHDDDGDFVIKTVYDAMKYMAGVFCKKYKLPTTWNHQLNRSESTDRGDVLNNAILAVFDINNRDGRTSKPFKEDRRRNFNKPTFTSQVVYTNFCLGVLNRVIQDEYRRQIKYEVVLETKIFENWNPNEIRPGAPKGAGPDMDKNDPGFESQ